MGNNENIAEDGKRTRFGQKGIDNTKGGRKPSIRKQLKELLLQDGRLKIPKEQVLDINPDGSIVIRVPTEMQLAMKLKQIALSGSGVNASRGIKMIMEQIDGKPKQEIEQTNINSVPDFSRLTDKEFILYSKLQEKLGIY